MRVCSVVSGMSDSLRPYGLYSLPGSSVHRILQVRILESTAMTSSRLSSWPRDWTCVSVFPALADRFFSTSTTWEVYTVYIGEGKLLVAVAKISPNDSDLREKFIYFSQIVSKLRVYVSGEAYFCLYVLFHLFPQYLEAKNWKWSQWFVVTFHWLSTWWSIPGCKRIWKTRVFSWTTQLKLWRDQWWF